MSCILIFILMWIDNYTLHSLRISTINAGCYLPGGSAWKYQNDDEVILDLKFDVSNINQNYRYCDSF